MTNRFYASDTGWQDRARCSGVTYDFTPDHEKDKELNFVRSLWCDRCPVRMECLAYALLYRVNGYWGGTNTAERRLLGYARNRVKCPVCKCKSLIKVQDHEICQGCGVSWNRVPDKEEGVPHDDRGTAGAGLPGQSRTGPAEPVGGGQRVQARAEVASRT